MIKFLFWLYRSKANKKGLAPIYLRITVKGKKVEIATGFFINPSQWDKRRQQVKGTSQSSVTINGYITTTKTKILQLQNNFNVAGSSALSADLVKQMLLGVSPENKTLLQLFDYHNSRIKQQIGKDYSEGTYKHYIVTRNSVENFLKHNYRINDIPLESLSHRFITDFEIYLKTKEGLMNNTAMKKIKQLKKVISVALANEWLLKNPFINFKCSFKKAKREALTKDEINLIASKEFLTDRLTTIRDIFLFACYTGLRFSDIQKINLSNINKGLDGELWLTVDTTKTDARCNIPLLPDALKIIERYSTNAECLNKQILFPVRSNQKVNEYLKEIGDIAGIKKTLHFHLARHTFATTITLNNGASLETVGKMLGHKSIKTTQIYAKMNDTRISHEMKLVKSKLEVFC